MSGWYRFCLTTNKDSYMAKLDNRRGQFYDPGLRRPYEDAVERANGLPDQAFSRLMLTEIDSIEAAVHHARSEYDRRLKLAKLPFKRLSFIERQDLVRTISAELRASLDLIKRNVLSQDEMLRIAASYAYISDMEAYNNEHPTYPDKGTE